MAVQDRNMHRDAKALRKSITVAPVNPAAVDSDIPFFAIQPRYNYRISDLSFYANVVATAAVLLKAAVCRILDAVGTPLFEAAAATTFTIEAFYQNVASVMTLRAATAAQAFTAAFTVTDGGWGVVLVQVSAAGAITTKAPNTTMAYATEEDALRNCPQPDAGNGVVGILTIEASGADFVAGTDNTDTAASFNTANRDGHVVNAAVSAARSQGNATLGTRLKDQAGARLLEGKGGAGGDLLVLTARSTGAGAFTAAAVTVDFRPFPAQGEGRGNMSVSQTDPDFVP